MAIGCTSVALLEEQAGKHFVINMLIVLRAHRIGLLVLRQDEQGARTLAPKRSQEIEVVVWDAMPTDDAGTGSALGQQVREEAVGPLVPDRRIAVTDGH